MNVFWKFFEDVTYTERKKCESFLEFLRLRLYTIEFKALYKYMSFKNNIISWSNINTIQDIIFQSEKYLA